MLVVSACVDLVVTSLKERLKDIDSRYPIYLIELGSGSGCFAFRFMQELFLQLQSCAELSGLDLRYVMTDFIPEIISVWKDNRFLKSFRERQKLDFCLFNPDAEEEPLSTACHGWKIEFQQLENAPTFIANALFDTIAVDGFTFSSGQAAEIFVSIEGNILDPMSSLLDNRLTLHQSNGAAVRLPYYNDPDLDAVLQAYLEQFENGALSIPIQSLSILQNLRRLTRNEMYLLCCSRGFTDLQGASGTTHLPYNDLSFPLNFDALRKYFAIAGGELVLPADLHSSATQCLAFGVLKRENCESSTLLSGKYQAITNSWLERTGLVSQKLHALETLTASSGAATSIDSFLDIISAGHCDPLLFLKCTAKLIDGMESELPTIDETRKAKLRDALKMVDANIYTFDGAVPFVANMDNLHDLFANLIRVWQRATAAHHQPIGRAFFAME